MRQDRLWRRHKPYVLRRMLVKNQCPGQFEASECFLRNRTCFQVSLRKLTLLLQFLRQKVRLGVRLDKRS